MLRRILQDLIAFPQSEPDIQVILLTFTKELNRFYQLILPIMGWIVYLRRFSVRLNLADFNMSHFVKVQADLHPVLIQPTTLVTRLEKECHVLTPATYAAAVNEISAELSALQPKIYIRGKFELWFLIQFFYRLIENFQAKSGPIAKGVKIRTQLSNSNAIEILGPRADIPQSLDRFLQINVVDRRRHLFGIPAAIRTIVSRLFRAGNND